MRLGALSVLTLLSGAAMCQPNATPPAFDIADVHVSPRGDWVKISTHEMQGGFLIGDRYELRHATMLDLIRTAYRVDADKVYGGPNWLDYDRFEIAAKTKPGTRPETLRLMLQTLLAERCQVAVKIDTRDVPGYILTKGKGELKLRTAADTSNSAACQALRPTFEGDAMRSHIQCRNVNMDVFVRSLRRLVSGPLGNLPVVDSTGLEGGWDIDLQYGVAPPGGAADAAVIEGLRSAGLNLVAGKIPQPVLVVENAREQPSANPPGVADSLPPLPPPEFEVASIKWPCNDNISTALRFEPGGRVTATCRSLVGLIGQAWNLGLFEKVEGMPKWLADTSSAKNNISIFAKAPAGFAPDAQNSAQARESLNSMLRALIIDRYKMKVHFEDRPMDAYTLVAARPKLTRADPAGRTGCTRQNAPVQGRAMMVHLTCRNMTMAQWAEQLQAYDATFVYPALDATGLEGAWDFALDYDAMSSLYARFPEFAGRAAPDGQAADPSGSLSFIAAIEKQLGLKLELHKRPESVLVIDHMEEKPSEN